MLLPLDEIRIGLLHPDRGVRDAVAQFYSYSKVSDPGAMPAVIRAIDEMSWRDAFSNYDFLQTLPQSETTLPWLIEKMDAVRGSRSALRSHVCDVLRRCIIGTDTSVHAPRLTEVNRLRCLDARNRQIVQERIEIASLSADELWHRLQSIYENQSEMRGFDSSSMSRAGLLLESLRKHPGFCGPQVLRILCRKATAYWPLKMAVTLAGDLRLESAVSKLLELFQQVVFDEECEQALASIGTNEIVDTLARGFCHEEFPQGGTVLVLGKIYTEHALSARLHLAEHTSDKTLQSLLLGSALEQFALPALEPARQFVLGSEPDEDAEYVRTVLIKASMLLNHRFPEFDAWPEEEVPDEIYRRRRLQPRRRMDLGIVA